ncbi:hypothetical protein C1752_01872 [Acaryochloris thomasi RCC1774]|uniref:Uncharacterized protein n=1 Tax=Acaryochloris thomasi RCC1774 TaxID=1764569 RepID=A0A2W1JKK1_9CYAN|nr:hypothetical protein [Acaryochloris thomasi]PZD73746.1 hypothetical protein C1752_01872 [Acaryochloris thomasi RCC1774]
MVLPNSLKIVQRAFVSTLVASSAFSVADSQSRYQKADQGFALPLAIGLGLVMLTLGMTTILVSQNSRSTAWQRKESGASQASAEGGFARTLAQLMRPNNAVLLARNYDPINPKTGKTYFGPDGMLNSGDEESAAIDEWGSATTTPCISPGIAPPNISYSGAFGTSGQYTLKAYRYNQTQKTASFLIEGTRDASASYIVTTLRVDTPEVFPGVLTSRSIYLQGRTVTGNNGNLFYNPGYSASPTFTGGTSPGDSKRSQSLDAIWSGSTDGFSGDAVKGKITACPIAFTWPVTPQGTDLGVLNSSRTLTAAGGGITYYQTPEIQLTGNDTVTVDTTSGPVYLYVHWWSSLRGNSKIQNIRTDGQPPRVGDLRIIMTAIDGAPLDLYDTSCIDTAFFYSPYLDLQIQTTGDGCPSPGNSNFDGVVWVEDVVNAPSSSTTRPPSDYDGTLITTTGATSGIAVPEDVSSLADVLSTVELPVKPKFRDVKTWQRVRL